MSNKTKSDKPDEAIRYCATYRDQKLYVIVCDTAIHLQMANTDQFLAVAAMSMLEELMNETLDSGNDLEYLAGLSFTASLSYNDLPRIIHDAIMYYLDQDNDKKEN